MIPAEYGEVGEEARASTQVVPSVILRPPFLPRGDNRFAPKKRDEQDLRVYVCDNCGKSCPFYLRSIPFDGQFVHPFQACRYSADVLKNKYLRGEVDVTWYCTLCHARPDERLDIHRTRARIGAVDDARIQRTMMRANSGFRTTWSR